MVFTRFTLPFIDYNRIFSKEELNQSTVVVSIIGKTCLTNAKASSARFHSFLNNLEELIDNNGCEDSYSVSSKFEGHYDKEENVIYLSLKTPVDSRQLLLLLKTAQEDLERSGYLNFWSKVKNSVARDILFMFSFSHIILLSNPGYSMNINIIQLFKVLSYVKIKYQAALSRILARYRDISEDWVFHGRLCSPRLTFFFKDCPYEIAIETDKGEQIYRIKKLEHSIEDQIYIALRKSRLVKNVCSRALFSIAPNDEFVFVRLNDNFDTLQDAFMDGYFGKSLKCKSGTREDESLFPPVSQYSSLFYENCIDPFRPSLDIPSSSTVLLPETAPLYTASPSSSVSSSYSDLSDDTLHSSESECAEVEDILENLERPQIPCHSFKEFLMKHIRKAHKEGFSDNMGKFSNMKPYFEVPLLKSWLLAVNAVLRDTDLCLKNQNHISIRLEKLLGTELKYSVARCKKVLPLALAVYQDNVSSHYNEITHEKKVKQAIAVFSHHARGPAQHQFIEQLTEECEKIWKSGRQTCEALSLNKNPCTKAKHQSTLSNSHSHLSESEHWSGVQFFSSCNCGAKQGPRQDPFTLRAANYDFYQIIGQECSCIHLERFNFPVFHPTSSDYREADVSNTPSNVEFIVQDIQHEFYDMNLDSQTLSTEKPLMRQVSTTEYLPGLIHLESPIGLLPRFPSWSLLCRGPSSLYSHNLGLHDCPGFIQGSSYLLPWDVSFREKDTCKPEPPEIIKKPPTTSSVQILKSSVRRNVRTTKEFVSVKIFIGVEYECARGHRFMSSAPGVVLKAVGTSVKEDAHKITEGNMPLFLPCPCGKVIAQLMRVHIVTPKAPVFVTIDPKVRPAPAPCPTFTTGESKPIALSQSTYWVLRLPYVYAADNKTYSVPVRMRNLKHGELLGPMYGIKQAQEL